MLIMGGARFGARSSWRPVLLIPHHCLSVSRLPQTPSWTRKCPSSSYSSQETLLFAITSNSSSQASPFEKLLIIPSNSYQKASCRNSLKTAGTLLCKLNVHIFLSIQCSHIFVNCVCHCASL